MDKPKEVPHRLYKYRKFDKYTYDMLENNYIFLSAADKLNDPSECEVSFDYGDYFDEDGNIKSAAYDMICKIISQYAAKDEVACVESIFKGVKSYEELKALQLQGYCKNSEEINTLNAITDSINTPEFRNQIKELLSIADVAHEKTGICSLSSISDSKKMWEIYAANSSGYCVEYDIQNYEHSNRIYPVTYTNKRQNNIIATIVADYILLLVSGLSSTTFTNDKLNFIKMFLVKSEKWAYEKEWRLLGDANDKITAPPIKTIYLGKNASIENEQKLTRYCVKNNIPLIKEGN